MPIYVVKFLAAHFSGLSIILSQGSLLTSSVRDLIKGCKLRKIRKENKKIIEERNAKSSNTSKKIKDK